MSASDSRVNFRCSKPLRRKLNEAAKRSGVTLSEQVRVTLERVYEVEPDSIWLPRALHSTQLEEPEQETPVKKKAS